MGKTGIVALVGAGPGDPGLITVTGLKRIQQAEVLVYDHLVAADLLQEAAPDAERIYVGKKAGHHTIEQSEINEILCRKARAGKRVVRLKGGDPYVFGRGGEEAAFLAEQAVPFEVVPGVTAATAACAAAGIPVTHRGTASLAVLVTGHEDPTKAESDIDWSALAALRGTLVFYMGVRNAASIARTLIANGRDADTPAAMVANGTLPDQATVTGTLATIADRSAEAGVRPPALLVVGEVVGLRDALAFFERRPLFGRTVVVTRAREQASVLAGRLRDLGAAVLECPTIRIEPPDDVGPLDEALARVSVFDWIVFTSVNAVRMVMARLSARTRDARSLSGVKLSAIGPATAEALRAAGLLADLMPGRYTSEDLLDELKAHSDLTGAAVLLPRADIAPEALREGLEQAGATITAVTAYRTVVDEPDPAVIDRLIAGGVDWVTFTSASTARNFAAVIGPERLAQVSGRVRYASIGPQTTAAAEFLGLPIAAEADEATIDGLVDAIINAGKGREEGDVRSLP